MDPELTEREPTFADATEIGQRLLRDRFRAELRAARGQGDHTDLARCAKDLATLILAELNAPGAIELHEQVYEFAYGLVEEETGQPIPRELQPDEDRISFANRV